MDSLAHHFGKARGWLVLLIIVPVISGLTSAAIVSNQPESVTVTALVQVTAPVGSTVKQAASTFVDAVDSPPVLAEVSSAVGVSKQDVASAVEARADSTSDSGTGLVEIRYTGTDEVNANSIVIAVAHSASNLLYASPLANSQTAVDQAEVEYQAQSDAATAAGLIQLQADVFAKQQRIAYLKNRPDQGAVAAEVQRTEAELAGLNNQVAQLAALKKKLDSAEAILLSAGKTLATNKAQLAAATTDSAVQVSAVTPVTGNVDVIRAGVAGAIIGLLLAIAIVGFIAVIRTPKRHDDEPVAGRPVDDESAKLEQSTTTR